MTTETNTPNEQLDTSPDVSAQLDEAVQMSRATTGPDLTDVAIHEASHRVVDGPHTLKTDVSDLLAWLRKDETLTETQAARARKIGFRAVVTLVVIVVAGVVVGQATQRQNNADIAKNLLHNQNYSSTEVLKEISHAANTYTSNEKVIDTFTIDTANPNPSQGVENFIDQHPNQISPSDLNFATTTALISGEDVEVDGSVQPGEKFQIAEEPLKDDEGVEREAIIVQRELPPPLPLKQN